MTPLADAAFEYAFEGWPVFPLKPGTKVPVTEHGVKDATTDISTVKKWWARWPNANIGLATGHAFDVFDVDGTIADALLSAVVNLDGPVVNTPSGGVHFYGVAGASGNRAKFDRNKGADWRGLGGYVVAPPSRDDTFCVHLRPRIFVRVVSF